MEYFISLLLLIGILIAAYYTTRFVAKHSYISQSKYMRVVDRIAIDAKTSIVIVDIDGTKQVLAINEHTIENLGVVGELSELPEIPKVDFQESFLKALHKKKSDEE